VRSLQERGEFPKLLHERLIGGMELMTPAKECNGDECFYNKRFLILVSSCLYNFSHLQFFYVWRHPELSEVVDKNKMYSKHGTCRI